MEKVRIRSLLKNIKLGEISLSARNPGESITNSTSPKFNQFEANPTQSCQNGIMYHSIIFDTAYQSNPANETTKNQNLYEPTINTLSTTKQNKRTTRIPNRSFMNATHIRMRDFQQNLYELGISKKSIMQRNFRSASKNVTIQVYSNKYIEKKQQPKQSKTEIKRLVVQRKRTYPDHFRINNIVKPKEILSKISFKLSQEQLGTPKQLKSIRLGFTKTLLTGERSRKRSQTFGPWQNESSPLLNINYSNL